MTFRWIESVSTTIKEKSKETCALNHVVHWCRLRMIDEWKKKGANAFLNSAPLQHHFGVCPLDPPVGFCPTRGPTPVLLGFLRPGASSWGV